MAYLPNQLRISTYFDAQDYMKHMHRLLEHMVTTLFGLDIDFSKGTNDYCPFVTLDRNRSLGVYLHADMMFTPTKGDLGKLRRMGYTKLTIGDFDNIDNQETYDLTAGTSSRREVVSMQERATVTKAQKVEVQPEVPVVVQDGETKVWGFESDRKEA